MKESILHNWWRMKLIRPLNLSTVQNQVIRIIDFGTYNLLHNGPDFSSAIIEIDGVILHGSIEMHVRASDWYRHKHQFDLNFNNVILHVVYEYDQDVYIGNNLLSTLLLNQTILYPSDSLNRENISCKSWLSSIPVEQLELWIENGFQHRLQLKTELWIKQSNNQNQLSILYKLIVMSFGMPSNQIPLEEIAERVKVQFITKYQIHLKVLIYGVAGFTDQLTETEKANWIFLQKHLDLKPIPFTLWKTKGMYPKNSPIALIDKLISFLTHVNIFELNTLCINRKINTKTDLLRLKKRLNLPKSLAEKLIINAILPYYFILNQDVETLTKLYTYLPKEKNYITEKWKQFEIIATNSMESQALLEIYNDFCSKKKCLSCVIGKYVLNK